MEARGGRPAVIGTFLLVAAQAAAPARAFEVSSVLGASYVTGEPLSGAISDRRVGLAGAIRIRYRNPYFLAPFVDVGYALLSSGAARIAAGEPDAGRVVSNHLGAWHVGAGVSLDVLRLRLGLAATAYVFGLRSSLAGVTSRTDSLAFGPLASASLRLIRASRFHMGVDAIAHMAPQAGIHYFTLGLSMHGDVIAW